MKIKNNLYKITLPDRPIKEVYDDCTTCKGTGRKDEKDCPDCNGRGYFVRRV